jgi:hypothetical protein
MLGRILFEAIVTMPTQKCLLCSSDGAAAEFDEVRGIMEIECRNSACGDYIITEEAATRIQGYSADEHLQLSHAAKEAVLQGLILELEIGDQHEITALAVTPRSRR